MFHVRAPVGAQTVVAMRFAVVTVASMAVAIACGAQQRVTRADAIASAIERGPRVALARTDSAAARAELMRALQYDNPVLGFEYTKDAPRHHVTVDAPLDVLWLRPSRARVWNAALDAASVRLMFARASIAYDTDTAYTQALAAAERARLSRITARDADSLLVIARLRRDAGDGSDLDFELAALNAGQLRNAAAADSLESIATVLALQVVMGIGATMPPVILADSLEPPAPLPPPAAGTPLLVTAAEHDVRRAEFGVALERRQRFAPVAFTIGFETHDPGGSGNQALPVIGVSLPIPVFNQNRGAVLVAQAEQDRARAQAALARLDAGAAIVRARQAFVVAQERATRSRELVDRANRVAALSLLGFREGATTLASVLEAQRIARDNLTQYVLEAAAARNAASLVRLLEMTTATPLNRSGQ